MVPERLVQSPTLIPVFERGAVSELLRKRPSPRLSGGGVKCAENLRPLLVSMGYK